MTDINNSFKPMLSPKEMLQKGIFGGTYFNKLVDYRVFPKDWFLDLDQSYFLSKNYNKKINYFNIKSGQSQEEWEAKGFPGMIKSNCKLCSATGLLDAPKLELRPDPGKIICTRCDGRIELSPEEWDLKGFPGMARSKCKLCEASGFLDDPLPKPLN